MKLYTADNKFGFTPEARVFSKLMHGISEEFMREFNYTAECANLNFDSSLMHDNIDFTWSGFNDSMPNYITETIVKLNQLQSEDLEDIFNQVKEKLLLEWKNAYLKQSYQQAFMQFDNICYKNSF